jgi:Ion channel
MSNNEPHPDTIGILLPAIGKVFQFVSRCSPLRLLKVFDPKLSARTVDFYVLIWVVLEVVIVVVSVSQWPIPQLPLVLIAGLRIIDILQAIVNVTLFDPEEVASIRRTLMLAGINFIELVVCFGVIYALNFDHLRNAGQPLTAFYFSVITQLTIGYGDVFPVGWLRIVAALQGLTGAFFVILVFGRIIASLPGIKTANRDQDANQ